VAAILIATSNVVAMLALGFFGKMYQQNLATLEDSEQNNYFHLISLAHADYRDNNVPSALARLDECPARRFSAAGCAMIYEPRRKHRPQEIGTPGIPFARTRVQVEYRCRKTKGGRYL
jgi:hypothetical protein